jgi:hypothetical protein
MPTSSDWPRKIIVLQAGVAVLLVQSLNQPLGEALASSCLVSMGIAWASR